ncbi:hypothetical protein FOZ60_010520 [Perkinsus olseni]|uniref:Uncharacterized protein n=1 Tax=Perkinsus olseni TaxID=32597 RepID=A0A7J6PBV4_PEROL|nr:hypothetical protein FOZ60_010520 [Perkinsus olseni]
MVETGEARALSGPEGFGRSQSYNEESYALYDALGCSIWNTSSPLFMVPLDLTDHHISDSFGSGNIAREDRHRPARAMRSTQRRPLRAILRTRTPRRGAVELRIRDGLWTALTIVEADLSWGFIHGSSDIFFAPDGFLDVHDMEIKALSEDILTSPLYLVSKTLEDYSATNISICAFHLGSTYSGIPVPSFVRLRYCPSAELHSTAPTPMMALCSPYHLAIRRVLLANPCLR